MRPDKTLDQIRNSKEVIVQRIDGGWASRKMLSQMGIHVGDTILVKRIGIIGGPIHIQIHGMEAALGRGIAKKVIVREK
jgi:Fe2+ transport system protein FeoA